MMLFQISSLIGKPILCLETNALVGTILDVVIDPDTGRVIAFKVSISLMTKPKIISCQDIVEIRNDCLIIAKESAVVEPKEILKINDILAKNLKVLGNWVKTKQGSWLGKVEDLLIESETLALIKIYVQGNALNLGFKPFLGTIKENQIISADNIVKVTAAAVIVKNEVVPKKKTAAKEKTESKVKATVPEPA